MERRNNLIDWKHTLTSRKLWLALAEFVGMLLLVVFGVAEETIEKVVALIMSGAGALAYVILTAALMVFFGVLTWIGIIKRDH